MQDTCVLTGTRKDIIDCEMAMAFARDAGVRYVERRNRSLLRLMQEEGTDLVVVWHPEGPRLFGEGHWLFYHPGMAQNRIAALRKGQTDPMIEAMQLKADMSVLDCTMGLASDALVAAYAAGKGGRVLALENSRLVAALVKWGMIIYKKGPGWLKEAQKRIEIVNMDHREFLVKAGDSSFDIVYFDPMFRIPVYSSSGISPLRSLADHSPLSLEALEEAKRVARFRVIVKERWNSPEFERLGIIEKVGGSSSRVAYGVIRIGG